MSHRPCNSRRSVGCKLRRVTGSAPHSLPRRLSMFPAIRWGATALVLATLFAGAAQASIITNPGFETGDFTGWALSGDLSFTAVDDFSPHSGRFSAGLATSVRTPGSTGSITQTLATTAGVSYDIEFWVNTAVTPNFFSVSFDGIVLDSLTNIRTAPRSNPRSTDCSVTPHWPRRRVPILFLRSNTTRGSGTLTTLASRQPPPFRSLEVCRSLAWA